MHDWVMWPVMVAGRAYASLAEVRADPPAWPELRLELLFDLLSDSPGFEVTTSGSTGIPKPLLVPKAAAAMSARATINYLGVPCGSNLLLALDPQPIGGRMVMIRALATGMDLDVCPAKALPEPPPGDYALTSLVPRQVRALLDESPETLQRMGQILVGGAPVDEALAQRLRGWPNPVWHTFGMTETLSHVALRRLDLGASDFNALPGCQFSQDAEGCLVIHALWVEGPVVTRDLVELTNETSFSWRGRADLAINSGGIKILPEQLEAEIRSQVGEHPLAITSVPDATWGEAVVLVSEVPLDISSLVLADQRHRPRFHLVHALPLTEAGKLDRVALQALVRTHPHLPRASYD